MTNTNDMPGEELLLDIALLKPYPKNAKKHPEEQIDQLAKAIEKDGWTTRILIDQNNTIINGHGRWMAATKLGLEKVPVLRRSDLTEEHIKKIRLVDNRVSDTGYDQDLLKDELAELASLDVGIEDFFTEAELTFAIDDIDIDLDALTDDIQNEVEEITGATQDKIDNEDDVAVPLKKVLGYTSVTLSQSRRLKKLVAHAELLTNRTGADALSTFIADHLGL